MEANIGSQILPTPKNADLIENATNVDIERGEGEHEGIGVRESGHGFMYHLKLCMLCLLRAIKLNDEGTKFGMAAEHKALNPFDDIVIMMNKGGVKEYHLIQAKHGQQRAEKKIIAKDFLKEKFNNWGNQFTLNKYFKGYCQIKGMPEFEHAKTNFIVCTNIDLDFDDLKENCISIKPHDETNGFMEVIRESKGKCYRLKSKGKSAIYKALKGKDNSDEDINNFINDFTIAVNLPNENDLVNIIQKEIAEIFNCINTELMASEFQDKLLEWLKQRKGTWLTREDGRRYASEIVDSINSLGSKGLDISHKLRETGAHVLQEYSVDIFSKIERFLNSKDHFLQIVTINNRSYLTLIKIHRTVENLIAYKYNDTSQNSVLYTRFKSFSSKESREYIQSAMNSEKAFNLLVVYSRGKDKVSRYVFKYLYKVSKICTKNKKKIILITEKETDISELEEEIPVLKSRQEEDNGLTFSHLSEETRKNLLSRNVVTFQGNKQKTNLASIACCGDARGSEAMDKMAKIIDSDTLFRLIKKKEIKVGVSLKGTPVLSDIYVNRKLENVITSEIITEDDLLKISSRFVFITDDAGSGKSTLLNSLVRKLTNTSKELESNLWICRINLNNYTGVLSEELEFRRNGKKSFDCSDTKKTIDFLVDILLESHVDTKLDTKFEKELFKLALQGSIEVFLLFDGFDEICPNYKDLALELMTSLQETKIGKMYVTTRPLRLDSEKVSKTERIMFSEGTHLKVVPLSEDDQNTFLLQYWSRAVGAEDERGLNKLRVVTFHCRRRVDQTTLTNPLTLLMTAEHWQETVAETYNALSHSESTRLPPKLNYIDLCKYYVSKKLKIYQIEKSRQCSGNISSDNKHNYFINAINNVHTHIALTKIFNEPIAKELRGEELSFDEYMGVELPKIGFVLHSASTYQFVHKTFAEHFVTEFIHNNPKRVGTVLDTDDWEGFMHNLPYTRWDKLFEYIIRGCFEIYAKSENQGRTDRLKYILTYIALVRQFGHETTKELTGDQGPEIDEHTKEELLSLGIVKEGRKKSRCWMGFKFIYWRFAEFLVKKFIEHHRYKALTVSNSRQANRMERYFDWWEDIVSVSSS